MMWTLLFLLLPVAAVSGWYFGVRQNRQRQSSSAATIHKDYFLGLNYLINEQPDKAVDVFIKLLEVDSDTVETHLALGNLFRRRGEVDRAIRIHQNIIARPHLEKDLRVQALNELGQDYMRAGVFDRAEGVFLELVELRDEPISGLQYLLNIYQQQKDWEQAIIVAKKLAAATSESKNKEIAHYYSELAELARKTNSNEAKRLLKKAFSYDKQCVRASIIQAEIEVEMGNYSAAIRYYKQVKHQDPDYLSEIIKPLSFCYSEVNDEPELIRFLQHCLHEHPRVPVILTLSEYLRKWHGDIVAIEFIAEQIKHNASLRGVNRLIELYMDNSAGDTKEKLTILHSLVDKLLSNKPVYRCKQCGFSGKSLFWQCPGCKDWNTIRPIHGLEGD